jgi:hypothetical protein
VSGSIGKIIKYVYTFDYPFYDDLFTSSPDYYVTRKLADEIKGSKLTGFSLEKISSRYSDQCLEEYPDAGSDPECYRLIITGEQEKDDFGLRHDTYLIVSQPALDLLKRFKIDNCEIKSPAEADEIDPDFAAAFPELVAELEAKRAKDK